MSSEPLFVDELLIPVVPDVRAVPALESIAFAQSPRKLLSLNPCWDDIDYVLTTIKAELIYALKDSMI